MAKKGLILVCIIHLLLVSCEKETDDGTIIIKAMPYLDLRALRANIVLASLLLTS